MQAIKVQAERYNARERAGTFYTQGLRAQGRGDGQLADKEYAQAAQQYAEARIAFGDAQTLAREEQREETLALQTQARETKEAALNAGAPELAAPTFQEGIDQEQQADRALEQDEFSAAGRFYTTAHEKFQQAHQHVQTEEERAEAVAVQQQAQAARKRGDASRHPAGCGAS
jgi:hypothetical protein